MASGDISVVGGGTAGLGLSTAERLARDGGRVAVLGRDQGRLDAAVERVQAAGASEAIGIITDATSEDQVAAAFRSIGERWGAINSLVTAIGPSGSGPFSGLGDLDWQAAFDEGVMTAVRCIRHALPWLQRASWARIVTITALSTKHQNPELIAYTAAKSALASITKNLSRSLGEEGILVNAVAPGPMLTDPIRKAVRAAGGDSTDAADAYRVMSERFGSRIDLQRVADPAEVAEVVAFCASQANTHMTGAHINVDGGSDFC
jgi:3-oxoacyl-[acyl-carrier protein] reductase